MFSDVNEAVEKHKRYMREAEVARLLREEAVRASLRSRLATLLHELAERLESTAASPETIPTS